MKNKISYLVLGAFLMGAAVECGAFEVEFDFSGVANAKAAAFAENRNPGNRAGDVALAVHDGNVGILNAANGADLDAVRAIRGVIVPNAGVGLGNAADPAPRHAEMPYGDDAANWGANNNAVVTDKLADYMLEAWLGALVADRATLQGIYNDVLSRLAARVCGEKAAAGESFDAYLGDQAANKVSFVKDILGAIGDEEQNRFRELLLKHAKGYHAAAFSNVPFDEEKMKTALARIKFGIVNGRVGHIAAADASIQGVLRENYNRTGVRKRGVLDICAAESEKVYEAALAKRNTAMRKAILGNGNPVVRQSNNADDEQPTQDTVTVTHNGVPKKMSAEDAEAFRKMRTGMKKDRFFDTHGSK